MEMGGVIGINTLGDYAFAYNTEKMAWGWMDENNEAQVRIR